MRPDTSSSENKNLVLVYINSLTTEDLYSPLRKEFQFVVLMHPSVLDFSESTKKINLDEISYELSNIIYLYTSIPCFLKIVF